jgi:ABC-type nickel/cobalt efflux system permease component RcnA
MGGLDQRIADLGASGSVLLALAIALLLGLRHATDPDHLTAVSTLALSDERRGARRAGLLGLAWGLGHATTLALIGTPLVLYDRSLPAGVQRALEVAVGVVIVALAVRLLVRWRRGYLHVHPHRHGEVTHAHPHVHEHAGVDAHPEAHAHPHAEALGRSPRAAYAIGLLHGAGGSAGAGLLLLAAVPDRGTAAVALAVFACGTALSMALVSAAFGHTLARQGVARQLERLVPAMGILAGLFGVWYALGALHTVPYLL